MNSRLMFGLCFTVSACGSQAHLRTPDTQPYLRKAMDTPHVQDPGSAPGRAAAAEPLGDSDATDVRPEPLEIDLKTLANKDGESSLGLSYKLDLAWNIDPRDNVGIPSGWDGAVFLRSNGDVAFDEAVNPTDFLESEGGLSGSARLGVATSSVTMRIEGNGKFESNQDFTARNASWGGSVYLVPLVDGNSELARWNPFDLPFRLSRLITGYDETLADRGLAFPLLRASLSRVSTSANDPRQLVGDASDFTRFDGEVNLQAPFLRLKDVHFDLELSYRYFRELDAGQAVRAAGLDEYDYFVAVLRLGRGTASLFGIERKIDHEDGWFLSYRVGKLPFNSGDVQAVEVGWSTYF